MTMPFANQADIPTGPARIEYESPPRFDDEGFERTERRNGACQCPECGLWWPSIEEPDMWTEDNSGRWIAEGWWGGVVCERCEVLMIEQPDGSGECYKLRGGQGSRNV